MNCEPNDFGAVLRIDPAGWSHSPAPGDSIADNGCCLTATSDETNHLRFDVIQQTLEATTLGALKTGDPVNLEHAVTPTTMLGGHIVQGHIDGVGRVSNVIDSASERRIRVEVPDAMMEGIVPKGSIALDGISLTLAAVGDRWFEVALIPTTLQLTNLGRIGEGDKVNLETDYIAKTVVNWLRLMKTEN